MNFLNIPPNIGDESRTDRASDYGSEGWGFESLQAHENRFLLTRTGFYFKYCES